MAIADNIQHYDMFIDGQDAAGSFFSDGFESGTLAAWSGAVP